MDFVQVTPLKSDIKDYSLLVKHNNLVQGKYSLEASEQKLLYKIFEEVQKKCYTTREITMSFQDFYVQYKSVLGKNITKKDFKMLIESLQGKFAYIIKGDEYIRTQWYKIHGKLDLSSVKLIIDEDVFDYIQSLDRNFTGLRIETIYAFKSFYSMRIYELLKQWSETKSSLSYELKVLKELLCVEDNTGYDNFTNFNKYVLSKAIKEINEKSELTVEMERIKEGRVIKGIHFIIKEDRSKKQGFDVPVENERATNMPSMHSICDEPNKPKKDDVEAFESFYIPSDVRLDKRVRRLFYLQFKDYDFNDINYYSLLLQAEECALVKDGKELITALNYPLFASILDTKLKDFDFKQQQKNDDIHNDYAGLSLEEREELFKTRTETA